MKAEISTERITAYERAVCYYTLPRTATPVTYGLVAVYAICVLESVAAFVYGLSTDNQMWKLAGATTFAAIVVFGMFAFTLRALINDWRKRAALAIARNVPGETDINDIPNPFADHLLLCRPSHPTSEVYACVTNEGAIEYYVEVRREQTHWRVHSPQDQLLFEILVEHDALRVGIFQMHPVRLSVYTKKKKTAAIVLRNTLRAPIAQVYALAPAEIRYDVKAGCVYVSERLVGRLYDLHGNTYLDIEREHATSGILAHFMTVK